MWTAEIGRVASLLTVTGLVQIFACIVFAYTARVIATRAMANQDVGAAAPTAGARLNQPR